jgi:hypothetical protein
MRIDQNICHHLVREQNEALTGYVGSLLEYGWNTCRHEFESDISYRTELHATPASNSRGIQRVKQNIILPILKQIIVIPFTFVFYGVYFYRISFYGIYFYKALKFFSIDCTVVRNT